MRESGTQRSLWVALTALTPGWRETKHRAASASHRRHGVGAARDGKDANPQGLTGLSFQERRVIIDQKLHAALQEIITRDAGRSTSGRRRSTAQGVLKRFGHAPR